MWNLAPGANVTAPVNGDFWVVTSGGAFGHANSVTFQLSAAGLGSYTDTFTPTANQTSFTATHTPASQVDIVLWLNGNRQDPANITALAGKVITVITGLLTSDTIAFTYTRLD